LSYFTSKVFCGNYIEKINGPKKSQIITAQFHCKQFRQLSIIYQYYFFCSSFPSRDVNKSHEIIRHKFSWNEFLEFRGLRVVKYQSRERIPAAEYNDFNVGAHFKQPHWPGSVSHYFPWRETQYKQYKQYRLQHSLRMTQLLSVDPMYGLSDSRPGGGSETAITFDVTISRWSVPVETVHSISSEWHWVEWLRNTESVHKRRWLLSPAAFFTYQQLQYSQRGSFPLPNVYHETEIVAPPGPSQVLIKPRDWPIETWRFPGN